MRALASARQPPKKPVSDARESALDIGNHAFWAAVAFVIIILVAVGLEAFERLLLWLKLIEENGFLDWAIKVVAYALAALDLAFLLAVVAKVSFRRWKSI
jgi:ABC-type Fe3+ transport system permease subunit